MMIRAIFVFTEILCFYQILRSINGFKATENFAYIFTNKQWIRWGTISLLFGYVIGISILWHYQADLALHLNLIGALLIPVMLVTIWRTTVKKVLFTFLLFFFISSIPALFYQWLSLPAIFSVLTLLVFISLLAELDVIHKIYSVIAKRPLLLNVWCFCAVLFALVILFASWYVPENAFFWLMLIPLCACLFVMVTIYSVKKYHEKQFIQELQNHSYLEIKAQLEKKANRFLETERLDLYELNSFWFSKTFTQTLEIEFKRLKLATDVNQEGNQIKIHIFK